jgi:CBS domain-containing protein
MGSPTIVAGVRRSLAAHPPYSELDEDALEFVARSVELAYFARGERIVGPSDGPPGSCWIVRQGLVEGRRPGRPDEPAASTLTPGDTFPVGALLAERAVVSEYWAVGDVFCWRLSKADFDTLIARSPAFLDFCKRRMGALLDLSNRALQASYAQQATQWRSLATPLGDLLRRAPVTVPADTPLRTVFERMEQERVGSVIVDDAQGIFTRQDVIGRVALPGVSLDAPISTVMTAPVLALDARATIAEAMLLMAERTIRHVPVRRDGVLAGVVTERDLFVLQRQSLRGIGEAIGAAGSTAALAQAAGDIREWSSTLVAQGVAAAFVTRLISRLNDQVTQRAIALACADHGPLLDRACWLALGSEGREEQTIATDQDNGLVLDDRADDATRARMRAFGEAVNASLDACGYPLCRGGIMAGNPAWCLPYGEWAALFEGWIDRGDPQSLLSANVFFDFRALAGDTSLAARLREQVTRQAAANARFLKQMSDNARRNGPPSSWTGGLLGHLFAQEAAQIDLKLHGTAPFVDAARLLALAHGVPATGTAERLQALAEAGTLPAGETRAWIEAFQFLQSLRLRVQHQPRDAAMNPNLLDTRTLSALDRRILKEAFRQARTLQQRLALDWPG